MRPVPFAAFSFTHWPTNYRTVTQRFRANPENYLPYGLPGHEGVDIRAPHGTPVYAVAGGMVSDIHLPPTGHNYGTFVRVRHADDYETTYAHLLSVGVELGQQVVGGQQIGTADNTGNSFGAHLHLTLKKLGQTFTDHCGNVWPYQIHDPEPFLLPFAGVAWPPAVPCQQPGQYDLAAYLIGTPDGRATQMSSGETFQYQTAGGFSYLVKNSQWEQFRVDSAYIWRGKDTSPGPAPGNAERPGALRWYWQRETGQDAARWCPRLMDVGQTWQGSGHHVQFYYKSDCAQSAINSGNATNRLTLMARYPQRTWGSITMSDVIEIRNGTGETFWCARGWGMVAWASAWGESHVIELFQPGQRTLTRESGCYG